MDAACPLGMGVRVAFKRDPAQSKSGLTDKQVDVYGVVGIYEESLDTTTSRVTQGFLILEKLSGVHEV